jgi:cytochrome c heme-lyase
MSSENPSQPEACPVDHATRAAWLKSNAAKNPFPVADMKAAAKSEGNSCDSNAIDQSPAPAQPTGLFRRFFGSSAPASPAVSPPAATLATDREISTIPRASAVDTSAHAPANSQGEGGVSKEGNWIYPSEKMFFEAMKRKGHQGDEKDMKTIVPIHNAVNERAWKEIKEWERPYGSEEQYEC